MIKIDNLFRDKKGNSVIYILLAMGIILLMLGNSVKQAPAEKNTSADTSRTAQAERVLSQIKGVGKVSIMISETQKSTSVISSKKEEEEPGTSVLIVAEGASNNAVREKLVRGASAALGVSPHRIEVFERKE